MASIHKNPNGTFRIRACLGREERTGKQIWRTTTFQRPEGLTPKAEEKTIRRMAEDWEARQRRDYERNLDAHRDRLTLERFTHEHWLSYMEGRGLSYNTLISYKKLSESLLDWAGARIRLAEISVETVSQFIRWLRVDKQYADRTVRGYFDCLRSILDYAVRCGYLEKNPAERLKEKPAVKHKEPDFLSMDEARAFLDALDSDDGMPELWKAYFQLLLFAGVRRGEGLALQWADYDAERRELKISKSVTLTGKPDADRVVKGTKTGKTRRVPVSETLSDALEARRRELEEHPERPLCLFVQDCTPEELEKLLAENGETLSVICDEGGIMETLTGGRYKDGVNLECLLNGFTGGEVQTNRVGRKAVYLENPCLSVNIMCQPVTVQDLISNVTFNRRGLTGRFLYAFPPSKGGSRSGNRPEPCPEAVDAYHGLIRALLNIQTDSPRVISFSPEAYHAYLEFFAEKEGLLKELDAEDPFRNWAARMHGHSIRLAGIVHVCMYRDKADTVPLSAETYRQAVTLTRYFKTHADYAFSMSGASGSQSEKDAQYIWRRLLSCVRGGGSLELSKHDSIRLCRRFTKAADMDAGLSELVQRGYIRVNTVKTGGRGRPSETIEVNPLALT